MPKESRMHHADEFGKSGSSSISGLDAPMIGASTSILVDGLVERESGATPSPWSVSVKGIVIALIVMFVFGLAVLALALKLNPAASHLQNQGTTSYDTKY